MSENFDREMAVRQLAPINRLPPENLEALIAVGEFQTVFDGQVVYVQGHQDEFVHYLIDGTVELLWNGNTVKRLPADSKAARRALDRPGRKRYTVRALSNCIVLRFPRSVYDAQLEEGNLLTGPRQVEVSEIAAEKSSNWMIKMLQSELFARLPAINIQKIFGRMQRITVAADQTIVKQGDVGDYYYVIERGFCEVSRQIPGGKEIHLADLQAGDSFGEAAIISNEPRGASVTMLSDGTLMRLSVDDFNELIREPLLRGMSVHTALSEIEEGAQWLDIRYPEDHAKSVLRNSHNMPLNVLRLQASRLDRAKRYIVCSTSPEHSAVGAFLLIERGFVVDYLDDSIPKLIAEHPGLVSEKAIDEGENSETSVVAFPGVSIALAAESEQAPPPPNADIEESKMDEQTGDPAKLENTIDKIDRLYSTKTAHERGEERVPIDKYAHTAVGQNLADLIDELHENQADLPRARVAPTDTSKRDGSALSPNEVFDVSSGTSGLSDTQGTDVLLVDTRAPLPLSHDEILDEEELFDEGDSLTQIVQDFEYRVRDYVESASYKRVAEVEVRYQEKIQRIRQAAAHEVRKRQQLARERYEQQYKKKELQLRAHYKKLMALANQISEQKAQLQQAKMQFEEKLSAANAVYKQVEDMRKTLRQHIGGLGQTPNDGSERESA